MTATLLRSPTNLTPEQRELRAQVHEMRHTFYDHLSRYGNQHTVTTHRRCFELYAKVEAIDPGIETAGEYRWLREARYSWRSPLNGDLVGRVDLLDEEDQRYAKYALVPRVYLIETRLLKGGQFSFNALNNLPAGCDAPCEDDAFVAKLYGIGLWDKGLVDDLKALWKAVEGQAPLEHAICRTLFGLANDRYLRYFRSLRDFTIQVVANIHRLSPGLRAMIGRRSYAIANGELVANVDLGRRECVTLSRQVRQAVAAEGAVSLDGQELQLTLDGCRLNINNRELSLAASADEELYGSNDLDSDLDAADDFYREADDLGDNDPQAAQEKATITARMLRELELFRGVAGRMMLSLRSELRKRIFAT